MSVFGIFCKEMKIENRCIILPFSKMTEIYIDYIQRTPNLGPKLKDRTHVLDADAIEKNK